MKKKPPTKPPTLAQLELAARSELTDALGACLSPDQAAQVQRKLDGYVDAIFNRHAEMLSMAEKVARAEAHQSGFEDGRDEGLEQALEDMPVTNGQTRINVLATLRKLDVDTACPFESKAYRAIADILENR